MLRFAVPDAAALPDASVRHAYLFGPDEVPIGGACVVGDGVLTAEKESGEAAGLAIQWRVDAPPPPGLAELPVGGSRGVFGVLMLRTCLLPDRAEPYLLALELARHRIMLVLNKLEEWGLFDLPMEDAILRQFERARQAFTEALVAQRRDGGGGGGSRGMIEAERLASLALSLAVDASERLALRQAERQMAGRLSGSLYARAAEQAGPSLASVDAPHGAQLPVKAADGGGIVLPASAMIGCAASPNVCTEELQRTAAGMCDFVAIPMRWADMEPQEGKYVFARTDRWIEWAVRTAKLPVVGGPVIDFRSSCVPEWLYIWENDYETLRELVYEHIRHVVTRYRRTVSRWTIASGLNVNDNFTFSLEQVMDLTRVCVLLLKKLQPGARVQVEIDEPWGEYHAVQRRSIPPLMYAEMLGQAGVPIDALALRIQMGHAARGRATRDLMALSDLLDRYATLDRPLAVSAIGAPSEPDGAGEGGGYWRSPWSVLTQAQWLAQAVAVAASKPYVHSVCWQELYDGPQAVEAPGVGLVSASGTPKPAARTLADLRRSLKEGRVPPALSGGG